MWKKLFLLCILFVSIWSCSNDDDLDIISALGTIENAPANFEECDWVINVDGNYYKPLRLPNQYEQEGLSVLFTYEDLNVQEVCQTPGAVLSSIRLIQIRQR